VIKALNRGAMDRFRNSATDVRWLPERNKLNQTASRTHTETHWNLTPVHAAHSGVMLDPSQTKNSPPKDKLFGGAFIKIKDCKQKWVPVVGTGGR
jgi:hypothetical protein